MKRDNKEKRQREALRRNAQLPRSANHVPVVDRIGTEEGKIRREIAIMKLCVHPNVVKFIEAIDDRTYDSVYLGAFSACFPSLR